VEGIIAAPAASVALLLEEDVLRIIKSMEG
jgi:hypothetical protein